MSEPTATAVVDNGTAVPPALVNGVPMLKISSKKIKQVIIRIQDGAIDWSSVKISRGELLTVLPVSSALPAMHTCRSNLVIQLFHLGSEPMYTASPLSTARRERRSRPSAYLVHPRATPEPASNGRLPRFALDHCRVYCQQHSVEGFAHDGLDGRCVRPVDQDAHGAGCRDVGSAHCASDAHGSGLDVDQAAMAGRRKSHRLQYRRGVVWGAGDDRSASYSRKVRRKSLQLRRSPG